MTRHSIRDDVISSLADCCEFSAKRFNELTANLSTRLVADLHLDKDACIDLIDIIEEDFDFNIEGDLKQVSTLLDLEDDPTGPPGADMTLGELVAVVERRIAEHAPKAVSQQAKAIKAGKKLHLIDTVGHVTVRTRCNVYLAAHGRDEAMIYTDKMAKTVYYGTNFVGDTTCKRCAAKFTAEERDVLERLGDGDLTDEHGDMVILSDDAPLDLMRETINNTKDEAPDFLLEYQSGNDSLRIAYTFPLKRWLRRVRDWLNFPERMRLRKFIRDHQTMLGTPVDAINFVLDDNAIRHDPYDALTFLQQWREGSPNLQKEWPEYKPKNEL